jgi:hypothetical protein
MLSARAVSALGGATALQLRRVTSNDASRAPVIVYAWINDAVALLAQGKREAAKAPGVFRGASKRWP